MNQKDFSMSKFVHYYAILEKNKKDEETILVGLQESDEVKVLSFKK